MAKALRKTKIVAQAVRQNVKSAMQLPMNVMEWAGMVLRSCKLTVGTSVEQTQRILQCLARCTAKYDASLEVNAYEVEPVAKRARRGRRKSVGATALAQASADSSEPKRPEEPDEDRINIGFRRMQAIQQILGGSHPIFLCSLAAALGMGRGLRPKRIQR